jgi:hypothetical protein
VELHTGLQPREAPAVLDAPAILARARAREDGPGLRLSRTDAATHLIAHAQPHSSTRRVVLDLRALHQTALMARRAPDVDWAEVRARFERAGCVRRFDAHVALAGELFATSFPVRLAAAGRRAARIELVLADHPLLAIADRPGHRVAVLRRERMERYFGTPLPGAEVWRARGRYLREVAVRRRALASEAKATAADRP